MRNPFLICAVSFLGGAAIGAYVGKAISDARASVEIQAAVNEMRDHYEQKFNKTSPVIEDVSTIEEPHETYTKEADTPSTNNQERAMKYMKLYNKPPLVSDDVDDQTEENNNEEDSDDEGSTGVSSEVFFITEEEFNFENDCNKIFLQYYQNGVLVDENDEEFGKNVVGGDRTFERFDEDGMVFVHNDTFNCDYSITFVPADF